jgi:tripartite-type tricarboxylate transporter receptor subunit TctC
VAEHLTQRLGKPFIVDNKPGAATVIGMEMAAKAPADGYTLLATGGGSLSVLPALRSNLPYDVARDFAPITQLVNAPVVVVTPSGRPYQKLADLIAAAKARPKELRYATYGMGSAPHLAGELLDSAAGTQMEGIPYKGASESLLALLRGEVDLGFETLSAAGAHVKAGKLRVLSLNGEQRSSFLPDVPGMGEQGLGAAAMEAFYCMAAPAGTPADVTARLAREVQEILALPDVKEKLASQFLEPAPMAPMRWPHS